MHAAYNRCFFYNAVNIVFDIYGMQAKLIAGIELAKLTLLRKILHFMRWDFYRI